METDQQLPETRGADQRQALKGCKGNLGGNVLYFDCVWLRNIVLAQN